MADGNVDFAFDCPCCLCFGRCDFDPYEGADFVLVCHYDDFLILFLTHTIPPDIVKRAGLGTLGPIAIGMLLVNMGSSVDVRMLKREWRSVAGSIISMIIGCRELFGHDSPYWSGKCPCLGARHQWRRDCDQYDGSGRP